MTKSIRYLLIIAVFLNACSNTKYLTGNQKLYVGGKVNIVNKNLSKNEKKDLSSELGALLRPKPNSTILGLRPKLYIYNITKTSKKKGLKHYLNTKFGEAPVLASSVDLDHNSKIVQSSLQNKGYFLAEVAGDTVSKAKKTTAIYTANTGPGYRIRRVIFPTGSGSLDTAIAGTAKESLLKAGDRYNFDIIKGERDRINANLKQEGFYFFSADDIIARVDSTNIGNHMVDIFVSVKTATPDKARNIYKINNIYVYPNYTLRDTSLMLDSAKRYDNYFVIQKRETIKPFVFKNTVQLRPGNVYNLEDHNKSLNRMISLGPFKYVKNRFEVVPADSPKLNVFYFLTQYPRKSLQFDILGRTTSANFTGSQVSVSWRNRNAFRGAELLTISLFGSTDVQVSGQNSGYNVYQAGISSSLSWPRFIAPFHINSSSAFVPRTNLAVQYALTNRTQLYSLNSFTGSFGYQWKTNIHKSHELNLLSVNYVNAANVTQQYRDSIISSKNPSLKHVIDNQLTFGPTYSYTYTNTTETYRTNTVYYNGKVGLSANLLGIISGADSPRVVGTIFNTPYNQYLKFENEIRYYHKLSAKSQFASRLLVGVGVPYGNSTIMPYSQQFFIGGTNSLRGFRARSIGPGTYLQPGGYINSSGFLADQSGDIKIEGNAEYRPNLFSIVRGALFVDAGNVWLLNKNGGLPGGEFTKDFINQLAADAGFGLRFDASILVLRLDLGFPIRKPWLPEGQRWVINQINFASSAWRSENLVFNVAIGYPF